MTSDVRLNARLDAQLARKLEYLKRRTRRSATDVVRQSIELYYQSVTGGAAESTQARELAGFIGCAAGPSDLSTSYKRDLAELIDRKS